MGFWFCREIAAQVASESVIRYRRGIIERDDDLYIFSLQIGTRW